MTSLRQTSLFSFEKWIKDTEWDYRLQAILDAGPLGPALSALPNGPDGSARNARSGPHNSGVRVGTNWICHRFR